MKKIFIIFRLLRSILNQHFFIINLNEKYGTKISKNIKFDFENLEDITIGRNVTIDDYSVVMVRNDSFSKSRISKLIIGNNTYIGEQNNIRACGGTISIGESCLISQQVSIIASNHNTLKDIYIMSQPWSLNKNHVHIGNDVWIGCGSQIMPGVTIEDGAIIAAGSVVIKDVPRNAIFGGVPAKLIRYRE